MSNSIPCRAKPDLQQINERPMTRHNRLWQINDTLYYSIISICLSIDELHHLTKPCGGVVPGLSTTNHKNNHTQVNIAKNKELNIRHIQTRLDNKYASEIRASAQLYSVLQLSQWWNKRFTSGNIAGAYWSLLSHPMVSAELAVRAYGEVHTLLQQAGASNYADLKYSSILEQRCTELALQLAEIETQLSRQQKKHEQNMQKMSSRLIEAMDAERQLQFASHRLKRLENGKELKQLRSSTAALNHKLTKTTLLAEHADEKYCRLAKKLERLEVEYRELSAKYNAIKNTPPKNPFRSPFLKTETH